LTCPSKQKKHPSGTAVDTGAPPPFGVTTIEVFGRKEKRKLLGLGFFFDFGTGIELRLALFHSSADFHCE
jgi:hypothetical protein